MNLDEIAGLADVMRAKGISEAQVGDVRLVLGPRPVSEREQEAWERLGAPAPKTEPAPAPIGPDGRPMSEHDRVLFGATLGDDWGAPA